MAMAVVTGVVVVVVSGAVFAAVAAVSAASAAGVAGTGGPVWGNQTSGMGGVGWSSLAKKFSASSRSLHPRKVALLPPWAPKVAHRLQEVKIPAPPICSPMDGRERASVCLSA